MTTNREIAAFIFDQIRQLGYQPYDIQYGNSYFIFDMGKDSVVHFRLKGVWKHWKFGMWINAKLLDSVSTAEDQKDHPVVEVFCQYDTQIDKFKPSRSDLVWRAAPRWWKTIGQNADPCWKLGNMLDMIRRHPFICYDGYCGTMQDWYTADSFILRFIRSEGAVYLTLLRKIFACAWCYPYTLIKCLLAGRSRCVESIRLARFAKENPGFRTSSVFQVYTCFTADATEEQMFKWRSRWFRKTEYGRFDYHDHAVHVHPFRQTGVDGLFLLKTRRQ